MEISEEFFWSHNDSIDLISKAVGVLFWFLFLPKAVLLTSVGCHGCCRNGAGREGWQFRSKAVLSCSALQPERHHLLYHEISSMPQRANPRLLCLCGYDRNSSDYNGSLCTLRPVFSILCGGQKLKCSAK